MGLKFKDINHILEAKHHRPQIYEFYHFEVKKVDLFEAKRSLVWIVTVTQHASNCRCKEVPQRCLLLMRQLLLLQLLLLWWWWWCLWSLVLGTGTIQAWFTFLVPQMEQGGRTWNLWWWWRFSINFHPSAGQATIISLLTDFRNIQAGNPYPKDPWDWYIYLQKWLILYNK